MMKRSIVLTGLSLLAVTNISLAGSVVCPATLTCNGDTGTCDNTSEWVLDAANAHQSFSGLQTFPISKIWAVKQGYRHNDPFQFLCTYQYGNSESHSFVSIYRSVRKLEGHWLYLGLGKTEAYCFTREPSACTGIL